MKHLFLFFLLVFLASCSLPLTNNIDLTKSKNTKVRIVQISDLHIVKKKTIYKNTIDKINTLSPDIIVFTGDQIESTEAIDLMKEYFAGITVDCSKYAILGNWEYWGNVDIVKYRESLQALGIKLLVNEQEIITVNGLSVSIYGIDDYLAGKASYNKYVIDTNAINLIFGHCPILFDSLQSTFNNYKNDFFMFSGHTHGGQITFFGIPVFLPKGCGVYSSGIYKVKNFNLYVSKGIGNSTVDFRLFAGPDIEVINL